MAECKYKGCTEQAWRKCPKGFCIYHSPNNSKDRTIARQIWDQARKRVQDGKDCNFQGWHFPRYSRGQAFNGIVFPGHAYFETATFEGIVGFSGATFTGEAYFEQAIFRGRTDFTQTTFQGQAHFRETRFKRRTNFIGATFEGPADFPRAKFLADANFSKSIFRGYADFRVSTFVGDAGFDGVKFEGVALFPRTTFQACTHFLGATFNSTADFGGIPIQERTSIVISLPSWELPFCKPTPFLKREQGEGPYRLAKESARRQGDYRLAGEYHFAEQCAIEYGKRKKYGWKFWRWIWEWFFIRTIFGYGEKVHRPLIAGLAVIFVWMGLYFFRGAIGPSDLCPEQLAAYQPSIWDSFYFSVVSFTTLGYGDIVPKLGFRGLAGIEAVLGAALMAVFIVALTRKYMR